MRANKTLLKKIFVLMLSICVLLKTAAFSVAAEDCDECVLDVMREGFYAFSESIDISSFMIMPEDLTVWVSSAIKDDPYLFYVNGRVSYSYKLNGHVLSIKPQYEMSREEVQESWTFCRDKVREIATLALKYESDVEKALFLHDYVCSNFDYDKTLENDSMLSFFESGFGTCQAYADTYSALLRECGIESHYVASDTIEHIWNLVKIEDQWYHVDLTWNDSASSGGEISRRHFLLSDRVAEERGHKDWYSSVDEECNDESYLDADFSDFFENDEMLETGRELEVSLKTLLSLRKKLKDIDEIKYEKSLDVNFDGRVDAADITFLRKKLVS